MSYPLSLLSELSSKALYTTLLASSGGLLLLLGYLRGRSLSLAAKYAAWQREAQEIEVATHDALYREPSDDTNENGKVLHPIAYPRISIVIPAYNSARQLEYTLPRFLGQRYAGSFEVIVADQRSEDDTELVVKSMKQHYPHLRYTIVPASSRHIEPRKLAVTLGIKAARSEWVIVVNPDSEPASLDWLQYYSENLSPGLDFVTAYYNYEDDGSRTARRAILERVYAFNERLSAFENNRPIDCESANYAVRKAWFVEEGGFSDSLTLPFGEEAFFTFNHAVSERTLLLCSPDTKLIEQIPTRDKLLSLRVGQAETFRRLGRTMIIRKIKERAVSLLLYIFLFLQVFYFFLRLSSVSREGVYVIDWIGFDLTWTVLIILGAWLPIIFLRRSLRVLGERWYGGYIFIFELLLPFRRLRIDLVRHTRKRSFIRRYI